MALEKLALKSFTSDVHLNVVLRDIEFKINETIDYFIPFTGAEDTDTDTYGRLRLLDTDASNILSLLWNEDDSLNRTLNLKVGGGSRTLDLSGNLSVESASSINQDLTDNANVIFNSVTLSYSGGLHLLDTDSSHDLIIKPGSDLGADKTLTLTTGDANRTITLSGNPTLNDWFDQSVKVAASPEFTTLTLNTIAAEATDVDTFLVSNAGLIKSRTGAEVLDDIGAADASHAMSTHSDEDSYNLATSGSILSSGTGGLTSGSAANTGKVVIYDGSDHKITITAPSIAGDFTLTLPATVGALNQYIKNEGSGNLGWDTPAGTGDVSAVANFGTDNVIIRSDDTGKAVQHTGSIINDSGIWGIGHTDVEAWGGTYSALEFPHTAIMFSSAVGQGFYMCNGIYYDGAWKHKDANVGGVFTVADDTLHWRYSAVAVKDDAASLSYKFHVNKDGKVLINESSNVNMTRGITINQDTADDEILALKSSDIAHGCTTYAETDTYAQFKKGAAATGALQIRAFGEAVSALQLEGWYTTDNSTKSTSGEAPVTLQAVKISGTGYGNTGANANIVRIRTRTGSAWKTLWICDEDGDTWQGGTMTCTNPIYTTATSANAANLYHAGTLNRAYRYSSSRRYKDRIKDLELDPSLLHNLRPVSFNSKCEPDDKNKRFHGLITEEIEQYYPDIILYDENNKAESYDTQMLITLLLAETQNQHKEIQELQHEVNELKEITNDLQ